MRPLIILLAATASLAQSARQTQASHTSEDLRGVSAVSRQVAWASGTHGTYLRTTDGGRTWTPAQVPEAAALDFRGVVAFSADEAFLMSAGPGNSSRIYYTSDAGRHWQLQFTATNPQSFFDSIAFWDRTHGIVLGDPIPDDSGQLKFELLITNDGQTWTHTASAQLPPPEEGEGAFAASNTCLAILQNSAVQQTNDVGASGKSATSNRAVSAAERNPASAPQGLDPNIWFGTGGKVARVFHSSDRGRTWKVFTTPITHGADSAGIFSIAFRDPDHGVIAGGDYKHPEQDGPNLAFTSDGGKTWSLSQIFPQSYYSAVAYDRKSLNNSASQTAVSSRPRSGEPALSLPKATCCSSERPTKTPDDNQAHIRLFLSTTKSIYDFRPPNNPTRISPAKTASLQFNAVSPYPTGGALFVGPKGSIATIP